MANETNDIFPVDENDTDVMVTITLDDGDVDCEILTIFEVDDKDYIALLPVDEHGTPLEENMVFLYRYYEDVDGEPAIDNIETDEEYEKVGETFEMLMVEQFPEED